MRPLVIIGTGGVGRQVLQIVRSVNEKAPKWKVIGFLDDNASRHGDYVHETPIVGGLEWLKERSGVSSAIAIGDPSIRKQVAVSLQRIGHTRVATLVHPKTEISSYVAIGKGSIIYPGVVIDTEVHIKEHVIINKGSTIGHDTIIEQFVTVSPGVNIGGAVTVKEQAFLGIGCSTVQNIVVGKRAIVGAGAAVIRDVPDGITCVGVPARVIE